MGLIQQIYKHLRLNRDIVLLIGIGLFLTVLIDNVFVSTLARDQQYRQNLVAQQVRAQVQSGLEEHVTALIALNVVYQNFVDISMYDFQQYGRSISTNAHAFRRLLFVDSNLIVRRVYPLNVQNQRILGINLAYRDIKNRLFQRTRLAGQTATSEITAFLGHQHIVLVISPIFRNPHEFVGYAMGEVSLPTLWKDLPNLNKPEFSDKYEVRIKDWEGNTFETGAPLLDSPNDTVVPVNVASENMTLRIHPRSRVLAAFWMAHFTVWAISLSMLFMLLMLMLASKGHKISLSEAHRQFEMVVESSPDGIVMLDDKLNVQLTNPVVQSWLGAQEGKEISGKNFFDCFTCHCPHVQKCRELSFLLCTSDQFKEELPETLETHINHPVEASTNKILRLNASKIQQNKNAFTDKNGFICILGDISSIKELERVRETYVATLTHDLKTPLIAQHLVLENILLGRAGTVTPQQQKLLSGAYDSVSDLIEMVHSTLVYYKLESASLVLHKEPASLALLIKDTLESLRVLAEKRQITLTLDTALDLADVEVDAIQMKRVFHNIISNAISYANRQSSVRVSLRLDSPDRFLVQVKNEGKGISPNDLVRIFEKYYSLSRKFKQIGTGLGLYISRRIIELHGGKIWAESVEGQETVFNLILPNVQHFS